MNKLLPILGIARGIAILSLILKSKTSNSWNCIERCTLFKKDQEWHNQVGDNIIAYSYPPNNVAKLKLIQVGPGDDYQVFIPV